jgi:hypothetical protein
VLSWDELSYPCRAGDTFEKISAEHYQGRADYAEALKLYNRNHPRASDVMRQQGVLTPGETVYIPPVFILEQRHGSAIPGAAPGAAPVSRPNFSTPPGGGP